MQSRVCGFPSTRSGRTRMACTSSLVRPNKGVIDEPDHIGAPGEPDQTCDGWYGPTAACHPGANEIVTCPWQELIRTLESKRKSPGSMSGRVPAAPPAKFRLCDHVGGLHRYDV